MKYYLGIDGGGTKTKLIITNEKRDLLYEVTTGPSSVDTVSSDLTFKAFSKGLTKLKLPDNLKFESVFAGLGGIVYREQKDTVTNLIKKLPHVNNKTIIKVENDMHNALYSGLLFDEGMTLIVGTGMVAYGKDLYGNEAKCGGWGFKEGDLGSGYSLGVFAIRHMIRAFDGRFDMDDFAKDIAKEFDFHEATDIIKLLDEFHLDRTKIASLAPLVTKHANLGNTKAINIIDLATDELALAVSGVFKKLQLSDEKLVIVGTLGNVDGLLKKQLHSKIKLIDNDITIIEPLIDPAFAAALMAINLTK